MELYKIEKIGKEIYYNRKYIQELLGVISSRQVISREGFLRLPSFPFYRGTFSLDVEKKVLSLLRTSCLPVLLKRSVLIFRPTAGFLYRFFPSLSQI